MNKFYRCVSCGLLMWLVFYVSGCSQNSNKKSYTYKEISKIGKTIERHDNYTILTKYGAYYDDYQLFSFDDQIDEILKSNSLERLDNDSYGSNSIKGSDDKALMAICAKDKKGARSIVVLEFNNKTRTVSFVSKEDYIYFEDLLDCPKDLLIDKNGFLPVVSSHSNELWKIDIQIHGYDKSTKNDYYGYVSIFYSKNALKKVETKIIPGITPDEKIKVDGQEYKIDRLLNNVGLPTEKIVIIVGSDVWNVSDDLETFETYKRIRNLYGDSFFRGLGSDWRFDHRCVIQDNELFVVLSQSESEGGAIATRVRETDDFAFKINVTNKTFEYVGASPRSFFCGVLY